MSRMVVVSIDEPHVFLVDYLEALSEGLSTQVPVYECLYRLSMQTLLRDVSAHTRVEDVLYPYLPHTTADEIIELTKDRLRFCYQPVLYLEREDPIDFSFTPSFDVMITIKPSLQKMREIALEEMDEIETNTTLW
jgi:hypothetical protein